MSKVEKILIYILALVLTAETLVLLELHKRDEAALQVMAGQNAELQANVTKQAQTIAELERVQAAAKEAVIAQSKLNHLLLENVTLIEPEEKANRGGNRLTSLGIYTITAYCSCEKCCGKYARDRPNGKVYGASGVELTAGVSVAGWLPLGTRIVIDGHEYIVQDRTARWIRDKYDSKIIDLYFADHEAALGWGKQQMEVWKINL